MGWREFVMWLAIHQRQTEGPEQSPDSWAGTENDPSWRALREQHLRATGRA